MAPGGWGAWLVVVASAAMAFLALVGLVAGLAAAELGARWRADLQGSATVRLPAGDAASLGRVLEILRASDGVAEARALDRDALQGLLAPWLGDGALLSELPIPRLVDVTLVGRGPDPAAMAEALTAAVPGA
ncbi:MAG: cell division protein FtsX, partial [Pseudomonadota bacterium]